MKKKVIEMVKKIAVGIVVVEYVVVGSQMAVYSQSSDQRDPADVSWGQWVTMWRLRPSQNEWGVAKQPVYSQAGVSVGVRV